jgi:hypothetical protein
VCISLAWQLLCLITDLSPAPALIALAADDVAALQTQEFYDFCDEHGIMVWQDAMFGGSHYPRNPEWLANIEEEITQQVGMCV